MRQRRWGRIEDMTFTPWKNYRDEFEQAIRCNTPEEAQAWMEANINYREEHFAQPRELARTIIKANLGYMAGYYDTAASKKIHDLFGADHPILGDISTGPVSPEAALKAGMEAVRK
jgi:hypothetical protein